MVIDLREIVHPARARIEPERAVEAVPRMRVRVDESGKNHFAGAVDALDLRLANEREKVRGLADGFYALSFDQHRAVFDALEFGVHGDDVSVDQQLSLGHGSLLCISALRCLPPQKSGLPRA